MTHDSKRAMAQNHAGRRQSGKALVEPHPNTPAFAMPVRPALLPFVLGLGMGTTFALGSCLAALRFPGNYGPWNKNTLSQLGNSHLNPDGYIAYLIGCAVSGAICVAFFISIGPWRNSGSKMQGKVLALVRLLGVAGGVGLFMNAIFPETSYALHHFWSGVVFNGMAAAAIVTPFALWRGDRTSRVITFFCLAGAAAVLVMFVFASDPSLEWLPVLLFLVFPPLVGYLGRDLGVPAGARQTGEQSAATSSKALSSAGKSATW